MEPSGTMAMNKKSTAPIDQAPRQERALELAGELMRRVASLADIAPRSKHSAAAAHVEAVEEIRDGLLELAAAQCWRCGANLIPPPAEVEHQIAINLRAAAWSGWPEDQFVSQCREAMIDGDRIVGLRAGAIVIRRGDGSLLEVFRKSA